MATFTTFLTSQHPQRALYLCDCEAAKVWKRHLANVDNAWCCCNGISL